MKVPVEPLLFVLTSLFSLAFTLLRLGRAEFGAALRIAVCILLEWVVIVCWGFRIDAIYPGKQYFAQTLLALVPLFAGGLITVNLAFMHRERTLFGGEAMPVFQETGADGRGCETPLLRMWRARRGVIVTVTEKELWIRPTGRAAWLSRIWGTVHRVKLLHIHQMEKLDGPKANIRLEYGAEDGWCRCVELQLKNPTAFVDAIREGQIEEAA